MTRTVPIILLVVLCSTPLRAQTRSLPEPAISGLPYYYPPERVEPREIETDVCIYGGTCAGVLAAIQADRMGQRVVLLEFGKHLGGLSSGGLSHTDGGDAAVCGGIAESSTTSSGRGTFDRRERKPRLRSCWNHVCTILGITAAVIAIRDGSTVYVGTS